jgi:hypothetical protein
MVTDGNELIVSRKGKWQEPLCSMVNAVLTEIELIDITYKGVDDEKE